MAQPGITKWLKRIFSVNSIGLIAALAGVLLAYRQLVREDGGSLTLDAPQVHDGQTPEHLNTAYTVCTAEDFVYTDSLAIFPKFRNRTKYAVKEMLLTGQLNSTENISSYIDNSWSHRSAESKILLRYEDTKVFPHTSVPFPFSKIEVRDDGEFGVDNRATYEGSEAPIGFNINISFIKVPTHDYDNFSTWRQRARRKLASRGISTEIPLIYYAHGQTVYIEADSVAAEIAAHSAPGPGTSRTTKSNGAATAAPDTVKPRFNLIENLDNLHFEKTGTYSKTVCNFTFKAPGQTGLALAIFSCKFTGDTIDVPWYKRLFDRSTSVSCRARWLNVSDTATFSRTETYALPNAKFLGLAKINPQAARRIKLRNDSIFNDTDTATILLFNSLSPENSKNDCSLIVPAHSSDAVPAGITPLSDYEIIYCDIPQARFSARHPIARVIIIIICYLFIGFFIWHVFEGMKWELNSKLAINLLIVALYTAISFILLDFIANMDAVL